MIVAKAMIISRKDRTLVTAGSYGSLAFVAGFIFGALRELVLIPSLGLQAGIWLEFLLLVPVIAAVGWWLTRRRQRSAIAAWTIGLGGTFLLLIIESLFAIGLMGMTVREHLVQFDVTRGALFPYGLLVMALTPVVAQWTQRR